MKKAFPLFGCAVLLLAGCSVKVASSLNKTLNGAVIDHHGDAVDSDYVLNTDFLLLYFSGHWCGPCRSFTPELVKYYNEKQGGQLYQVLFVSSDHSDTEMKHYMQSTEMPWPAVVYHSEARKIIKRQYAGSGIPQLVLLDNNGRILADSFKGNKYLGPQHVLNELEKRLEKRLKKREVDPVGISEITGKDLPTPSKLAKKFRVDGFGKTKNENMAFINGDIVMAGQKLDDGVMVENITDSFVEISYEKNRYKLFP
ncbi:thioredoxin-like domain-containing protein [Pontiella agarivorans]|uniref:Thioredoxin-like domain-containing protein n=1 Tax=Pontiella agarivorans TaxID=3038953 RepID=A0ABU5MZQ4_9BACT|nr:thioredoxin-like domain-containing protein [Pontiella agarivorans]MDZ8119695.1 thioredoxin-like domain-containing protein [Pontiella agarivorans]